ncbi:MAG TPA: polysaccharide biosynthesis/export family protein [Chthoniobacteraceae bacterium]|nr:polysaccharide biosynthesis/export family protein [Chthoniobacteraceae bacterium]
MKTIRFVALLLVLLAPCALRAQSAAPVRKGDTLDLHVTGIPPEDSSQFGSYVVDDSGMINLPFNVAIKVEGMVPTQIQQAIQSRYIQEGIYTHPTVNITQNAVARFVNVMGEVKTPQRVIYTADLTLMNSINACGGFSDFANKKNVDLKRGNDVKKYNCLDIEHGKITDPPVLPGDQITVHQSF